MVAHCISMGVTLKSLTFSHFWNYIGNASLSITQNILSYCCCLFFISFPEKMRLCDFCFFYLDGALPSFPWDQVENIVKLWSDPKLAKDASLSISFLNVIVNQEPFRPSVICLTKCIFWSGTPSKPVSELILVLINIDLCQHYKFNSDLFV